MAELRERVNHLQQENERLRTRLETDRVENPQGVAQPVPLTRADKGKEPTLPDHNDHPADDEFSSDSSPLPRSSPPQNNAEVESRKRPPCRLAGLLVVRDAVREERPARTDPIRNWPRNEYLPDSGVWSPSFYLSSTHSGRLPPLMQHFNPLSGDHTTCCLPP